MIFWSEIEIRDARVRIVLECLSTKRQSEIEGKNKK